MSSASVQQLPQSENVDPNDPVWIERYESVSRIYNYPMVNNTVEKGKEWYQYAKDKSGVIRFGLNTTEKVIGYISKPVQNTLEKLDDYVLPLDKFANDQLGNAEQINSDYVTPMINKTLEMAKTTKDSIVAKTVTPVEKTLEKTIETIDIKLDSVVGLGQEYIPTPINNLVVEAGNLADGLVDQIFPPPENEDLEKLTAEDVYALEKRATFLLKLRKRTNLQSLQSVPTNSYNTIMKYAKNTSKDQILALSGSADQLVKLATRIQSTTYVMTSDATKKALESVYGLLDQIARVSGSLLLHAPSLDSTEAVATIQELLKMVKNSRDNVLAMAENNERIAKFKNDCNEFLNKASSVIKEQVDNSFSKINSLKKSDNIVISQTVNILNELVLKTIDLLSITSPSITSSPSKESTNPEQKQNE